MGSILSLASTRYRANQFDEVLYNNSSFKRQKTSLSSYDESPRLIPSLPDELSIQILAKVPRICYFNLRLVSQKWKQTIMSHELFQLRKELGSTEEWLYVLTKADEELTWHALDPLSRKWQRLPPIPNVNAEESKISSSGIRLWNILAPHLKIPEVIRSWFGQKQPFDQMPFCGCAIGAVDGCLYVLGGFLRASTTSCVCRYDPVVNRWNEIAPMSKARAYSKTSILNNKLYVVGGVSQFRGGLLPLQSAEVFDPCTSTWSEVPSMPFAKSQLLPNAFWSDMLKPIATGMTSYMGRLYVSQSLYSWPFFVDAGGEIYDPETNSWAEMPIGMAEGWPARQAGSKLSIVVDDELYSFDPSSSREYAKIKVYDQKEDAWKVAVGKVPVYDSTDSESPNLLASFHGKIHVIAKDSNHKVVVMQADVRDNLDSPRWSSVSDSGASSDEPFASIVEPEAVIWKVVACRDIRSAEIVSCQVVDV
ncbi:F-box/kelch-repeat protein At1g22040 [Euphorbia lathyris]|uniref:F-box/kelch-repeat protein At1g22040 n=1 Tax=Euphorbia lathyris TaxID=212925 RepID=UPI00331346F5